MASTTVVRTNVAQMEMITFSVTFSEITQYANISVNVPGLKVGDLVFVNNQFDPGTTVQYFVTNPQVYSADTLSMSILPRFDVGNDPVFGPSSSEGTWTAVVFRPEYIPGLPNNVFVTL